MAARENIESMLSPERFSRPNVSGTPVRRSAQRSCVRVQLAGCIAVLCLTLSATAQTATQKDAKAIVDDAVSQYNLGHYAESAGLFEKAYQLDPAPILLFNIGQCHRRLGNNDLALFFYRRYLEQAPPDAADRANVIQRVADLERTVREQAELKDKPPPGVGGGTARNGAGAQTGTAASLFPTSTPPQTGVHETESVPAAQNLRTAAWVAGGVAAASLIFGGVEAIVWSTRANRFNNHVGVTVADPTTSVKNCGADETQHGGPGCATLYDDVSSARTLSIVGLAAGGLLAAGSAILFSTSTPQSRNNAVANVSSGCVTNLFAASVACRITF
jgi:hypothetical protein